MSHPLGEDEFPLLTFLAVDIAIMVFIWAALTLAFPKRLRIGMKKNSIRLNGTPSRRRRKIEKFQYQRLMANSLVFVGIYVFFGNLVVWFWWFLDASVVFVFCLLIAWLVWLSHAFVAALVNFEAAQRRRQREYLMLDMSKRF